MTALVTLPDERGWDGHSTWNSVKKEKGKYEQVKEQNHLMSERPRVWLILQGFPKMVPPYQKLRGTLAEKLGEMLVY